MVEKSVQELGNLNKEALGQIQDLPRTGTVDFKADVKIINEKSKVEILEHKISTDPVITSQPNHGLESKQGGKPPPSVNENIDYRSGNTVKQD